MAGARPKPNDTTGRQREKLQKENAEELKRREGELTMQQSVDREEKQGVTDLTRGGARGQTRLPGQTGAGTIDADGFMQSAGEGETLLPSPAAPGLTTATTGGTLAAGTKSYRVSAVNASGETAAGPAATIATTGATSTVTLNWAAVAGATGYRVYGRTGGSEKRLASPGTNTYVDTGAATEGVDLPSRPTSSRAPAIKTNSTAVTGTGTETGSAVPGGTIADQQVRKTVDTRNVTNVGAVGGPDVEAPRLARGAQESEDGGQVRQVEDQTKVIRVNEDLEQVTIGAGNNYDFEAGRQYRVPKIVADHLEEKGYVWH